MNKQLINKYKPEFDHWLNGGSVLIKSNLGWCPIAKEFAWSCNISVDALFVINDDYAEFRKALAEGKTIEYLGQTSNVWHEVPEPDFNLHPTCYRIKPDESKFKVGDFVKFTDISNKHPKQIIKIEDEVAYTEFNKCLLTQLTLWTPVKGEWCWFYDSKSSKSAALAKFNEKCNDKFISNNDVPWKCCEPFLNSLPSYLKNN